jgi:hypothetical protein
MSAPVDRWIVKISLIRERSKSVGPLPYTSHSEIDRFTWTPSTKRKALELFEKLKEIDFNV